MKKLNKLKAKRIVEIENIYSGLSRWQRVQLARHPKRPYSLDYINYFSPDFIELHGDRHFMDDPAVVAGLGHFGDQKVEIYTDLTIASSQNSVVTAGISGSTGALDITDSGSTDINGALALSGAGTITLDAATLGADATTVGGAIAFGGAVTADKGGATAVGTGAGAGQRRAEHAPPASHW